MRTSVLVLMLPKLSPRTRLSMPCALRRFPRESAETMDVDEGTESAEWSGGRLMLKGQSKPAPGPDSGGSVGEPSGESVDSREICELTDG